MTGRILRHIAACGALAVDGKASLLWNGRMSSNAMNLARALLVVPALMALPHFAAAAPLGAQGAGLSGAGTTVAHAATGEIPICHAHEDGTPFHCYCDGLFNLLCKS